MSSTQFSARNANASESAKPLDGASVSEPERGAALTTTPTVA